jgi:carboxyl-terminal processing protease
MKKFLPFSRTFIRTLSITGIVCGLVCGLAFATATKKNDPPADFYEELSRLNKVLSEVNIKYVEDVDPAELSEAAVQGIRNILDPHTAVYGPKDYEDLKVSTDGEFGGVGITISIRDNILTVISPMTGTPAFNLGIRAGDRIMKIDGKDTKGITSDDAVSKLRGKVGTDVTVAIEREGVAELMDFTITRAKIVVHAVPFSGMLTKDIGYIKIASFSLKTTNDVEDAIHKLQAQGMKELIIDLRYNPGGLLNQAIEIGELFLKKGNVIVSTRGRTQKTESHARRDGILSPNVPLVVLVNQGSASASEIVAGAIQDWDRGLIIGKTSFGKGSVQTIFPLDNQGHALKLTTAFYYLPFGRCINKPENGIKGLTLRENEESEEADSLKKDTTAVDTFVTNAGRKMFGKGGITPDIDIELSPLPWVVQVQERMAMYFKFAVKIRPALEASGTKIDLNWQVPDSLFRQFKAFCNKDTNFTKVKSNALATTDILEDAILKEQNYMGDSSKTIADTLLARRVKEMKSALESRRDAQFEENKKYIMDGIKRELLTAIAGDSISTTFTLKSDDQVNEAIKYLSDTKLYKKAISAPTKNSNGNAKTKKK